MHVFQELFSQKGNDIMACLDQTLGLIRETHFVSPWCVTFNYSQSRLLRLTLRSPSLDLSTQKVSKMTFTALEKEQQTPNVKFNVKTVDAQSIPAPLVHQFFCLFLSGSLPRFFCRCHSFETSSRHVKVKSYLQIEKETY